MDVSVTSPYLYSYTQMTLKKGRGLNGYSAKGHGRILVIVRVYLSSRFREVGGVHDNIVEY